MEDKETRTFPQEETSPNSMGELNTGIAKKGKALLSRRNFLKTSAVGATGLTAAGAIIGQVVLKKMKNLRMIRQSQRI